MTTLVIDDAGNKIIVNGKTYCVEDEEADYRQFQQEMMRLSWQRQKIRELESQLATFQKAR